MGDGPHQYKPTRVFRGALGVRPVSEGCFPLGIVFDEFPSAFQDKVRPAVGVLLGEDANVVPSRLGIPFAQRQTATLAVHDGAYDGAFQGVFQAGFQIHQDMFQMGVDGVVPAAQESPIGAVEDELHCPGQTVQGLVPGITLPHIATCPAWL